MADYGIGKRLSQNKLNTGNITLKSLLSYAIFQLILRSKLDPSKSSVSGCLPDDEKKSFVRNILCRSVYRAQLKHDPLPMLLLVITLYTVESVYGSVHFYGRPMV